MRILIVEDEVKIRMGISRLLTSHTHHTVVGEAKNGKEGLEMINRYHPQLVISDIRMPVMDGLTAARTIRDLERQDAKTIPIIAMTANAFREDAERCMEAGMNAHLAKPLDDEKIKQTIREELRKQNACHE